MPGSASAPSEAAWSQASSIAAGRAASVWCFHDNRESSPPPGGSERNYQLNWKSPTSYASSCKRLRLDVSEGSTTSPIHHTADFKFTK